MAVDPSLLCRVAAVIPDQGNPGDMRSGTRPVHEQELRPVRRAGREGVVVPGRPPPARPKTLLVAILIRVMATGASDSSYVAGRARWPLRRLFERRVCDKSI